MDLLFELNWALMKFKHRAEDRAQEENARFYAKYPDLWVEHEEERKEKLSRCVLNSNEKCYGPAFCTTNGFGRCSPYLGDSGY